MEGVEIVKKIGDGAYGSVYEVNTPQGVRACKVVTDDHPRGGIMNLNEIDIQRRLSHPHIVPIERFIRTQTGICLLMPLCRPLTKTGTIEQCFKLASAVQFLHRHGIGHLDIKEENVVITEKGEPALIDFGMAQYLGLLGKRMDLPVITIHYRPPELLHRPPLFVTTSADVWSLGILFIVMMTGKSPYTGLRDMMTEWDMLLKVKLLFNYQNRRLSLTKMFSHVANRELLIDLVSQMTETLPEKRISIDRVLTHPLFSRFKPIMTTGPAEVPRPLKLDPDLSERVISYAMARYWKCHAECLLLATSLIARVKDRLPWTEGIIPAALWMAAKMTGDWCHKLPDYLDVDAMKTIESQIVTVLDGVLYPHLSTVGGAVWEYLR
jgi:serine/threonine protein kinase